MRSEEELAPQNSLWHLRQMQRLPRYWTYLLLSDRGETYAGQTGNLRRRLRQHNSRANRGWTRGRKWRLLAAECYFDRRSALWTERLLKRSPKFRRGWLDQKKGRAERLRRFFGILS